MAQKRERAVFIGCRNDQILINNMPSLRKEPPKLKDAIDNLDETINFKLKKTPSNYAKQSMKGRLPSWYKIQASLFM